LVVEKETEDRFLETQAEYWKCGSGWVLAGCTLQLIHATTALNAAEELNYSTSWELERAGHNFYVDAGGLWMKENQMQCLRVSAS